jgi:hypothetical protein
MQLQLRELQEETGPRVKLDRAISGGLLKYSTQGNPTAG